MNRLLLLICTFVVAGSVLAQRYDWQATPAKNPGYRFEDVYFLNPDTGFAVHYPENSSFGILGFITRTTDGGNTWTTVFPPSNICFRDIGFTDALHGWAGTYQHSDIAGDTCILYQTVDGGDTWSGVKNFPGPKNTGICGLRVINDSTIYGVGRYSGPAGFYKTTNNGKSWSYNNLDSLAGGLVDTYFFNADTGYAVGASGQYSSGHGVVLYTTNAGHNWKKVHVTAHASELCWKVVFPSRKIGYCSIEPFSSMASQYFLKTTDGGLTWNDIKYNGGPSDGYNVEGIGFINDTTGWVGGGTDVYGTNDGGATWYMDTWGHNLNRFRFLSNGLAYAAGKNIYKMSLMTTDLKRPVPRVDIKPVYPNPTSNLAYFEFFVYKSARSKLSVFDMQGNEVKVLFDKVLEYGNQHYVWESRDIPSGIYVYRLVCGDQALSQKLIIEK